MRGITIPLAGIGLALAGCAGAGEAGGGPATGATSGECNAEPAQGMVGQQASAEVGQRLMALTGARQLRWAPPDSAMTMDFRPDRLTVAYDRAMSIERITCG